MMGLDEVIAMAASGSIALLCSHEEFRESFKNAVLETQQGVSLGSDMIVAVGRKPTK